MNAILIGLMYAIPLANGLVLYWAASSVSQSYVDGAMAGVFGAVAAFAVTIMSHILIILVRLTRGAGRDLMLFCFRPLMIIVQLSAVLLTIGNGVAIVATSFYLPILLTHHYLPKLTMFFGLAAAYAALRISKVIISGSPKAVLSVNGSILSRTQASRLWREVDDLAKQLGTAAPERIMISLDNTICVTEAAVEIEATKYHGRTLILSLPLIKCLSVDQTRAVIAHELAHFSGNDTKYCLKFFPIFKGAKDSITGMRHTLERYGAFATVTATPAMILMNIFLSAFAKAEAEISRRCEKDADTKAGEIAGNLNLIKALVVVHGLGIYWSINEESVFKALHEGGKTTNNIVALYSERTATVDLSKVAEHLIQTSTPHPFHSHPVLKQRIEYLGETISILKDAGTWIEKEPNALIMEVANLAEIEIKLTDIENKHNTWLSTITKRYGGQSVPVGTHIPCPTCSNSFYFEGEFECQSCKEKKREVA